MIKVFPSILGCDLLNIGAEIEKLEKAGADGFHLDVMDGHFVPNISFGLDVVSSIKKATKIPLEVHLMVEKPDLYIPSFGNLGLNIITFHIESYCDPSRTISLIKSFGCKAGIVLCPSTHESSIEYLLDELDLILVMGVSPGHCNQKFICAQLMKIKILKRIIGTRKIQIAVDGGINKENSKLIRESGADIIISAGYIFRSMDYNTAISELRDQ